MATRLPLTIDFHVHGRGLGHASRSAPVVERLRRAGHRVIVRGSEATLARMGEPLSNRSDHVAPGPRVFSRMRRRFVEDLARQRRTRPDVLVTDGDAPSLLAARANSVPSVALGHGVLFVASRLPGIDTRLHLREALNASTACVLADAWVATHFAPIELEVPRARLVRVDLACRLDRTRRPTGPVVSYFRDGGGDAWVDALRVRGLPLAPFATGDRRRPAHEFHAALEVATGVIGTAGSNLCAEAAHLGIPFLAIAADWDAEQRINAQLVERHGLGFAARLEHLDDALVDRFAALARRAERRPAPAAPDPVSTGDAVLDAVERVHRERTWAARPAFTLG